MNLRQEIWLIFRMWLLALLAAVVICGPVLYSEEQTHQWQMRRDMPRHYRPTCQLVGDDVYCPGPVPDGWVVAR
jgi:hypothetical protein